MNLRRDDPDVAPDDPGMIMHAAAQDAVRDIAILAQHAINTGVADGNQQLIEWASSVGTARDVPGARRRATDALRAAAESNRALQNLALDVLNRLRGL